MLPALYKGAIEKNHTTVQASYTNSNIMEIRSKKAALTLNFERIRLY
jgi:hypothetical protein